MKKIIAGLIAAVLFLGLTNTGVVKAEPGTKYIRDDATGGDCTLIGNWDGGTKTCTLTTNLTETIQIASNDITLDGNGRTLTGSGTGYGVYLDGRTGVTIKNLTVKMFSVGIYLYDSSNNNVLINNNASSNTRGISLEMSSSYNTLTANIANNNGKGIELAYSSNNNILTSNTVLNNFFSGIIIWWSNNNILTDNIVNSTYYSGIGLGYSSNNTLTGNTLSDNGNGINLFRSPWPPGDPNKIYNNNFLNNTGQVSVQEASGNIFNLDKPIGGNYWSDWATPDNDNDGFVDNPYVFTAGQDNLPWTKQSGWEVPADTTPPTTTAMLSGTLGNNGWYTSDVQVTLTAADNAGGSGVAKTEYSFDGANWNLYSTPFTISSEGNTTVYYRSTDNAGNVEVVSATTPISYSYGFGGPCGQYYWDQIYKAESPGGRLTKSAISTIYWVFGSQNQYYLDYTLYDNSTGAMIQVGSGAIWVHDVNNPPNVPPPNNPMVTNIINPVAFNTILFHIGQYCTVHYIDATQSQVAWLTEKSITIRIDKTPPTILGVATTSPNANGWYNSDVTVHFDANDAVSGLASVTPDMILSVEGSNQSVFGTAVDNAGNTASAMVSGINIDKTPPVITITTPTTYSLYTVGTTLDFSASDNLSGVESVVGELTNSFGVSQTVSTGFLPVPGVYTLLVKSSDFADNYSESEIIYFVVYDPAGGFATGGGWFNPDSESTLPGGRANFGFVAKYQSGGSTGNLEFQYKDANINLKSTTINWLVISEVSAQFQGTGTINGTGFYTFRVLAKDNAEPGVGADYFDIKIWAGTDTEANPIHKAKNVLAGGNIVVHKK